MGKSIPVEIDAQTAPIKDEYVVGTLFDKLAFNPINIYDSSSTNAVTNVIFIDLSTCGDVIKHVSDGRIIEGSHATGETVK